ncbi:MAG: phospho-N-acetylmuramoyl-pentapeptide-transferase [Chloroflexi bacterium]|nr:phospho-N-acetylmuramoyl-pentapeptide-transferase [Chloroflexota bacterium]
MTDPVSYALFVGGVTFACALIAGYPLLILLGQLGVGKQIRAELPDTHQVKVGTLTMGGILIWGSAFAATAIFNIVNSRSIVVPLLATAATGLLGAIDDLLPLVRESGEGLSARLKFAVLLVIALVVATATYLALGLDYLFIPTSLERWHLGIFYVPLAAFAIVATANAVNLTDGLDSLAGVCAAVAFVAYGIIAHLQGQAPLVTFCFTVVGALLAFLWFNAHPAQLLMGDTGSLAIGAALATVALMTGHLLLLPLIGCVFVAETISVMMQVGYFKLTGGRRLFRMSPLHHHFEMLGWSETHIAQRFWLVSMFAAMVGVALALV